MNCPSCGHENRATARFCGECASPLTREVVCPSCGAANAAHQSFCDQCAEPIEAELGPAPDPRSYTPKHLVEKILTSRSALEGERKQVTVLFADVKGSTELTADIDPEEWHRILNRFFQILADGVHRFEGVVNQYTGDGIMALFGAPIAHEDHAQRACYAALHLTEELGKHSRELKRTKGLGFSTRIGLNSGEVVVGKIGDDLRMDYTAQGHTVNLAARMEHLADPGKAYLTEHTAALASGYFELDDLGPFEIAGAREPVGVFELCGTGRLRTRLDVSRLRGFSRFVGRTNEVEALENALGRVLEGQGQVVGIVGEAGVGKSRLCYEFTERCRGRDVSVYQAHCPPHGRSIPFLPVLELFRDYFGVGEQDRDQTAREKIAGRLLLLDPSYEEVLPLLFDFLGVSDPARSAPPMEPDARQRKLQTFVRSLNQTRSEREPAVLFIDDLHWIDPGSDAFVSQVVDTVSGTRTLLLVNFRPEYHAEWMGRSYYQQLPLLPLGEAAVDELLVDLLGTDPTTEGLSDLIRERTGGNPFFVEELVHSLAESGGLEGDRGAYRRVGRIEELQVPATVESVLAARIDRLGERDKYLLQTASVIGKEFTESILRGVVELPASEMEGALSTLEAAEFIHEEALYPEREYAFRHPLTREVAYQSLLRERRANVHADVARALEEVHPDELDSHAALIAHHWEGAGEPIVAARWHGRAANQPASALSHWRSVRDLLGPSPESSELSLALEACNQILWQGGRLGMTEAERSAVVLEGRSLAERTGDRGSLVGFLLRVVIGQALIGRVTEGEDVLLEARDLADTMDNPILTRVVLALMAQIHLFRGRLSEAIATSDEALELGAGEGAYRLLYVRAMTLVNLGRLEEAAPLVEQATERAREADDLAFLASAHSTGVTLARVVGDPKAALAHGQQAVEIEERVGSQAGLTMAYAALGGAWVLNERWEEARAALTRGLSIVSETGAGLVFRNSILCDLAEVHLRLGDPIEAQALSREGIEVAQQSGARPFEFQAWVSLARALLEGEGVSSTKALESALESAAAIMEEMGAKAFAPRLHETRAELARLLGDERKRRAELEEAHRLYAEMGAGPNADRIAKELAS
jgi:class 3 adenylate cyclase/tetratricopeptide (TPR) repeat protein